MAKASYTTQFEIDELWVAGDALGAQVQFNRDGWDVTIRIPASPSDFRMTEMQGFKTLGAFGHSSSGTLDGISRVQTVRVVQVSVAREEPFGAAPEDQNAELVSAFVKEAQAVAHDRTVLGYWKARIGPRPARVLGASDRVPPSSSPSGPVRHSRLVSLIRRSHASLGRQLRREAHDRDRTCR